MILSRISSREYREDSNENNFWGFDPPVILEKIKHDVARTERPHSRSRDNTPIKSIVQLDQALFRNPCLRVNSREAKNRAVAIRSRCNELPCEAKSGNMEMPDPFGFDPINLLIHLAPQVKKTEAEPGRAAVDSNETFGSTSPLVESLCSHAHQKAKAYHVSSQKARSPTAIMAGHRAPSRLHRRLSPYRRGNKSSRSRVHQRSQSLRGRRRIARMFTMGRNQYRRL